MLLEVPCVENDCSFIWTGLGVVLAFDLSAALIPVWIFSEDKVPVCILFTQIKPVCFEGTLTAWAHRPLPTGSPAVWQELWRNESVCSMASRKCAEILWWVFLLQQIDSSPLSIQIIVSFKPSTYVIGWIQTFSMFLLLAVEKPWSLREIGMWRSLKHPHWGFVFCFMFRYLQPTPIWSSHRNKICNINLFFLSHMVYSPVQLLNKQWFTGNVCNYCGSEIPAQLTSILKLEILRLYDERAKCSLWVLKVPK